MFKKERNQQTEGDKSDALNVIKNWYEERYDYAITQRNILLLILLVITVFTAILTLVIAFVINSKTFDPFVIQIDETTGEAKIVKPIDSSTLSGNETLAKYFIKKYVVARETYNFVDFDNITRQTIKLLSTQPIYRQYIGYALDEERSPFVKYGANNSTFLVVKSWSRLEGQKYLLRFSIHETTEQRNVYHKIAIVEFDYVTMTLTEDELDINPIGFQVIGYRVDDDNS